MRRWRDERGFSVLEMTWASAIAMVVLALVATALYAASRNQRTLSDLQQAVTTARSALDRVAREMREADDIDEVVAGTQVQAWIDEDADGIRDPDELVTFAIASGELLRSDHNGDVVLARDLVAGSSVTVQAANAGVLLRIALAVDLEADRPPRAIVVESEVLARNA